MISSGGGPRIPERKGGPIAVDDCIAEVALIREACMEAFARAKHIAPSNVLADIESIEEEFRCSLVRTIVGIELTRKVCVAAFARAKRLAPGNVLALIESFEEEFRCSLVRACAGLTREHRA